MPLMKSEQGETDCFCFHLFIFESFCATRILAKWKQDTFSFFLKLEIRFVIKKYTENKSSFIILSIKGDQEQ